MTETLELFFFFFYWCVANIKAFFLAGAEIVVVVVVIVRIGLEKLGYVYWWSFMATCLTVIRG